MQVSIYNIYNLREDSRVVCVRPYIGVYKIDSAILIIHSYFSMSPRIRQTDRELRVVWCKYQIRLVDHQKAKASYECANSLAQWERIREEIETCRRREISLLKPTLTFVSSRPYAPLASHTDSVPSRKSPSKREVPEPPALPK